MLNDLPGEFHDSKHQGSTSEPGKISPSLNKKKMAGIKMTAKKITRAYFNGLIEKEICMINIVFTSKMPGRETHLVTLPENGVRMLRAELEMMMNENNYLKKIGGAAALLVARLDRVSLQGGTAMAAFTLAGLINGMPEDMMSDAMRMIKSS